MRARVAMCERGTIHAGLANALRRIRALAHR
jgi:hypothetical protein